MKYLNYSSSWLITLVFTGFLAVGCSKKSDPEVDRPIITEPVPHPAGLISLSSDWVKQNGLMTNFPAGIEVYRKSSAYNGKAMNAYCVVFDPKSTLIEFKPVLPAQNKKLSELYTEEPGIKYAALNGGFFGVNTSYSLVKYNNVIQAVNIKSLNRPYNGVSTTYYPTRGAFGIFSSGTAEVTWIYHVGEGSGAIYKYPSPSANELNKAPLPQPSQNFPEGAAVWNISDAIGGSPVLIKAGQTVVSDKEELIDINNITSRARSAIGFTSAGAVVLLAVEGNNSSGGVGLNLQELASLMKDMGCIGALNLDGGGSTSMVVNGEQTLKPSDSAGERPVMGAIIIKKR